MGKAIHENNENWIPTNKKYFTVIQFEDIKTTKLQVYLLHDKNSAFESIFAVVY